MSLRFYIGASGSGKSTKLYQEIAARAKAEPERNFLILVPDQFTMQTQMDLVRHSGVNGIMNVDVLSFGRLAHRVEEACGKDPRTVLDDTGKSLVLRRVAGKLAEQTTVLGSRLNRIGYINEVKSVFSEFMQYGVKGEDLIRMAESAGASGSRGALRHKLEDLQILYNGFHDYIKEKYVTTEETLEQTARRLPECALVRDAVIALDGFTGFTPVQNRVLQVLMGLAQEVIVTLTMDPEDVKRSLGEQSLFALSRKTYDTLERLAFEAQVVRGRDVILNVGDVCPGTLPGFVNSDMLGHLERHLFRTQMQESVPMLSEEKDDPLKGIRILEASTVREEVRQVFIALKEYLRATGAAYRDTAIIAGDLARYAGELERQAALYDIPLYLDQNRGLLLNPCTEYMRSALKVLTENYSQDAVFYYLRCALSDFEREEADLLEDYCRRWGIRGKRKWTTLFTCGGSDKNSGEQLPRLNELRERMLAQLEPLTRPCTTAAEHVRALYDFLVQTDTQDKLQNKADAFREHKDEIHASEYEQVYRKVIDLLDQIMSLLGEEEMDRKEFLQVLEAGFAEIRVGTIPRKVDQVMAGDMERTRLKPVRALFFVGVNDGSIPRAASGGGLLSDLDREFLKESGVELAPTPREQMYIQRLYLYLNMTKPTELLCMSYARMDGAGKALRPSYLIDTVRRMFEVLPVERPEEREFADQLQGPADSQIYLSHMLREYAGGTTAAASKEEENLLMLLRVLSQSDEQGEEQLRRLMEAAFHRYEDRPLGKAAAAALFGTQLYSTVSRLEKFAGCAYAHFLQYGLELKEQTAYEIQAVDLGNIYHEVLKNFAERLQRDHKTWKEFTREYAEQVVGRLVDSQAAAYSAALLYDTARNRYTISRIKRIMVRTVMALQYQVSKGSFEPHRFEAVFSDADDLQSVNIALNEEERLHLTGKIDRVDIMEDRSEGQERIYVKIIDYKSGSKDFSLAGLYRGQELQLVVYMNAAMELEQKAHPDAQVLPGAMLYYRMQDPLADQVNPEDAAGLEEALEERVNREILKKLRMKGVINEADAVIQGLDKEFEKASDVVPLEWKANHTLTAASAAVSEADLELIRKFCTHKVTELAEQILAGRISLDPYRTDEKHSACTYCAYRRQCGFDKKIPGQEEREDLKMKDDEIYQKMKEELE